MKAYTVIQLFILPASALSPANLTDYSPTNNIVDPVTELAAHGEPCGYGSKLGAVCQGGLCCSLENQRCSDSLLSCSSVNCMPLYSTSCVLQGKINAELSEKVENSQLEKRMNAVQPTISFQNTTSQVDSNINDEIQPPPLNYLESLPRPKMGPVPYGQVITSCTDPGTMALTFDDGPWKYTSDLLDLLESEDVRATFFVCGGNMDSDQMTGHGHPKLLRRMFNSGHQIGSHTWGHPDLGSIDDNNILEQMYLNEQAFISVLGVLPTYFRPPYLSVDAATLEAMNRLGYHIISLDVDTRDWAGDYGAAEQNFVQALESSDSSSSSKLVLAHDIHEQTVHELAKFMIDGAREAGYRFVTVGECIGDHFANWYRNPYDGGSWQKKYYHGSDGNHRHAGEKYHDNNSYEEQKDSIMERHNHPRQESLSKYPKQMMDDPEITATEAANPSGLMIHALKALPTTAILHSPGKPTASTETPLNPSDRQPHFTGLHMEREGVEREKREELPTRTRILNFLKELYHGPSHVKQIDKYAKETNFEQEGSHGHHRSNIHPLEATAAAFFHASPSTTVLLLTVVALIFAFQ